MKQLHKKIVITTSIILATVILAPAKTHALCPYDINQSVSMWSNMPSSPLGQNQNMSDIPPTELSFTIRGPRSGKSVTWGVRTNIDTQIFTKIFANYLAILKPFTDIEEDIAKIYLTSQPERLASWNRYYCIDALDEIRTGTKSVSKTVDYIDVYEEIIPVTCPPTPPPTPDDDQKELPIIEHNPPQEQECERRELREHPFSDTQTQSSNTSMPYYNGLRELGRKVAFIVNDQYCNNDTECINQNYFCDQNTKPTPRDPAGYGKSGTCKLKKESENNFNNLTSNIIQTRCQNNPLCINNQVIQFQKIKNQIIRVDILCTNLIAQWQNNQTANHNGSLCLYGPKHYDIGASLPQNNYPSAPHVRLTEITGGAIMSNDGFVNFPYDFTLFMSNDEIGNPDCATGGPLCRLDEYYRRVLNKTTQFTQDEIEKIYEIPSKSFAGLEITGAATHKNDPWIYTMLPSMGGIAIFSEEARRFNQTLLPAGMYAMRDGRNSAKLRTDNGVGRGYVEINDKPIGINPVINADGSIGNVPNSQTPPFIYSQKNGFAMAVLTLANDGTQDIPYLSITNNDAQVAPLREVPGGGMNWWNPYYVFINSAGNAIIIGGKGDNYQYTIYNYKNNSFSEWQNLSNLDTLTKQIKISFDKYDKMHVAYHEGEGSSNVIYTRYRFDNLSLTQEITVRINFPNELVAYASAPLTITSDVLGIAHIAANVRPNNLGETHEDPGSVNFFENDIYYISILPNGALFPQTPELAVSAKIDHDNGYSEVPRNSQNNKIPPFNGIAHYFASTGSSIAVNYYLGMQEVYIVYINDNISHDNSIGRRKQAAYAKRNPQTKRWTQNLKLTSRIHNDYGRFAGINIDQFGNVNVTLFDYGTKYHANTKNFDGEGAKQCEFKYDKNLFIAGRNYQQFIACGLNDQHVKYVVAPSNPTSGGRLQLLDQRRIINPAILSNNQINY